ncbi:MAG: lysoplasmalogenase [Mariniphaga sp.]|nr:lysoplasmalogenase [Mariniphaga sp.]
MNSIPAKNYWLYSLLFIQVFMALLALSGFGFFFKSGSAGFGILIILLVWFRELKQSKDVWMIVLAFLFSIGGDWFMSNRQDNTEMFVAGIALFFVAHIGYLMFALMNGRIRWIFTVILLAGYLVFFFTRLYPSIDNQLLMFAALVYLFISCFSLGAAVGIEANPVVKWAYVFGIFLVLFSDTIIAYNEFAGYSELNFLILPTYYAAHISVTFSLIKQKISQNKSLKK